MAFLSPLTDSTTHATSTPTPTPASPTVTSSSSSSSAGVAAAGEGAQSSVPFPTAPPIHAHDGDGEDERGVGVGGGGGGGARLRKVATTVRVRLRGGVRYRVTFWGHPQRDRIAWTTTPAHPAPIALHINPTHPTHPTKPTEPTECIELVGTVAEAQDVHALVHLRLRPGSEAEEEVCRCILVLLWLLSARSGDGCGAGAIVEAYNDDAGEMVEMVEEVGATVEPMRLGWYDGLEAALETHADDSNSACHPPNASTTTKTTQPERALRSAALAIAVATLVVLGLIIALAALAGFQTWGPKGEMHAALVAESEMSDETLAYLCGVELHTLSIRARPPTRSVTASLPVSFHCRTLYLRLLHA